MFNILNIPSTRENKLFLTDTCSRHLDSKGERHRGTPKTYYLLVLFLKLLRLTKHNQAIMLEEHVIDRA